MPSTNIEWELIGKGLIELQARLLPFVNEEMTKSYGEEWLTKPDMLKVIQRKNYQKHYSLDNLDIDILLDVIDENTIWQKVFQKTFDRQHRGEIIKLKKVRDRHAHPSASNKFSLDEADQALYSMLVLIEIVSPNENKEIKALSEEALKLRYQGQTSEGSSTKEDEQESNSTNTKTENSTINQTQIPINNNGNEIPTQTGIVPSGEKTGFFNKKLISICSYFSFLLLVLSAIWVGGQYVLANKDERPKQLNINKSTKPKYELQAKSLKIGILSNPKDYTDLEAYLRSQFGNKVQVTIDGSKSISYGEVRNRIVRKEWDIVFALSPMLSVAAKNNNYHFAARMFPNSPPYYRSALFVKSNSSIQSLNDLKPTTTIALGDFNSASSFYMPAYDLFGKSLQVNMGHRGKKIIEMVKAGQADVGAGAYGSAIKDDPSLRVIHISRKIPSSSVYLSPKLSDSDREIIKKILVDAPKDVKDKANYDAGQEPDYSYLVKISQKAEEVFKCADFKQNQVNFFCQDNVSIENHTYSNDAPKIVGKINGWSRKDNNTEQFNLSGQDNKVYLLTIPRQILNQVPGASNPLALQNKEVQITGVLPKEVGQKVLELQISNSNQLTVGG